MPWYSFRWSLPTLTLLFFRHPTFLSPSPSFLCFLSYLCCDSSSRLDRLDHVQYRIHSNPDRIKSKPFSSSSFLFNIGLTHQTGYTLHGLPTHLPNCWNLQSAVRIPSQPIQPGHPGSPTHTARTQHPQQACPTHCSVLTISYDTPRAHTQAHTWGSNLPFTPTNTVKEPLHCLRSFRQRVETLINASPPFPSVRVAH